MKTQFHGPSPAESIIAPAASLIQLRVKAISLGGPDAGLAPAAAALQSIQLPLHSCRVLTVVTAFGAGRRCIPKVLGNGSMAAPGGGNTVELRGEKHIRPVFIHLIPNVGLVSQSGTMLSFSIPHFVEHHTM